MYNERTNLQHFFNNVMIQLGYYDWTLNMVQKSCEGYCWSRRKIIDMGTNVRIPKELLLHEIAHIQTARFCNQAHNPIFWKRFEYLMYKFLPNNEISKYNKMHKTFTTNGYYKLVYRRD